MNKNGSTWYDTNGELIQAHGGMILEHEGMYYWYGENKNGATSIAPSGDIRVDFIGISCYSSPELHELDIRGAGPGSLRRTGTRPLQGQSGGAPQSSVQ